MPDEDAPEPAEDGQGWWSRLHHHFRSVVSAEREHAHGPAPDAEPRSWIRRLEGRMRRWVAERVAEQRLLWFLRSERAVTAHHPDDMHADDAERWVRSELRRDGLRHLAWMFVDGGIYLASLPLTPIPGPNLLSLYFSFRAIGHFLSWLGARHGLRHVAWTYNASGSLAELRRLPGMKPADQAALAREIGSRLNLRHLDRFLARMALAGP